MSRLIINLAAGVTLALAALPGTASAQTPAESPFIAMLRKGDPQGTGFVRRTDIDAALAEIQTRQLAQAKATWASIASLVGLAPEAGSVTMRQLVDATLRELDAADADRDGTVTAAEMKAHLDRQPDPARRAGLAERLLAPDANHDGAVSPEERKVTLSPEDAAQTIERDKLIESAEGTVVWQAKAIDDLFQRNAGPDGRLDIAAMERRLAEAAKAASEARKN